MGGRSNAPPPPPAGGGKSRGPAGRGLNERRNYFSDRRKECLGVTRCVNVPMRVWVHLTFVFTPVISQLFYFLTIDT